MISVCVWSNKWSLKNFMVSLKCLNPIPQQCKLSSALYYQKLCGSDFLQSRLKMLLKISEAAVIKNYWNSPVPMISNYKDVFQKAHCHCISYVILKFDQIDQLLTMITIKLSSTFIWTPLRYESGKFPGQVQQFQQLTITGSNIFYHVRVRRAITDVSLY